MKKTFLAGLGFSLLAFVLSEGFLETLKISRKTAEEAVWYSFSNYSYSGPSEKTYHNFAVPVRIAMIKEIGAFAKTYTRSQGFQERYAAYREDRKPSPPQVPVPAAQLKKQQKDALEKNIKEIEASMGSYTGDLKKGMENLVKELKQQVKDLDDPEKTMFGPQLDVIQKQVYDEQKVDYQNKLRAWEKEFPASSDAMIRQALTHFLQLSSTVDFSAKLQKGPDNKMIFVNPDYENKSPDWKFIFRSGKESSDAAREIATQWLGEMK